MELEELKKNWTMLNDRIEKVEMVNERLVKGMVELRTKSVHNQLVNKQRNALIGAIIIPLAFVLRYKYIYGISEAIEPVLNIFILLSLGLVIFRIDYLRLFMKMDISKATPTKAQYYLLRYKRRYMIEHYSSYIIGIIGSIAFVIWGIVFMYNTHQDHPETAISTNQSIILVIIASTSATAYICWKGYKYAKEHMKELKDLEEGFQELKEYEETTV